MTANNPEPDPELDLGLGLNAGSRHYRAYIGPPADYDLVAAMTFGLLTTLGLRQHHKLLDIGCGSLRVARLMIPYLNAGGYHGIEPNRWLVEEGIAKEVGDSQITIKQPAFYFSDSARELRADYFDFAVAQSIFSHTGSDLLAQWLADVARVLKPGGALAATFLVGEDDPQQSGWVYPGCVKYKIQTLEARAERYGLSFQLLDWRHPRQVWALFARPEFDASWFAYRPLHWNTWLDHGRKK